MEILLSLAFLGILELVQFFKVRGAVVPYLLARPTWVRWGLYYAAVVTILLFGEFEEREFIYFQF